MTNGPGTTAAAAMVLFICAAARAQPAGTPSAVETVELTRTLEPSLVRVEVTLQFDKGQPPTGAGLTEQCPNCGRFHVQRGGEYVEHERPFEVGGYALSSTHILAPELTAHPRFVSGIEIVHGDTHVTATPIAHALEQHAILLELDSPLPTVEPLSFDADGDGPYRILSHNRANGSWTTHVSSLSLDSITVRSDRSFTTAPTRGVIVSATGQPVGMTMTSELATDESWKGSPQQWNWVTAETRDAMLARVTELCDTTVIRTKLDLRSPKTSQEYNPYSYGNEGDEATELDVLALRVDSQTILVLAELQPQVTARVESITVFPAGGEPITATFEATLRDYGAFLARLDTPLGQESTLSTQSIVDFQHRLLPAAEISMQGEDRIAYYNTVRISGYEVGWRRNLYPSVPNDSESLFVFDGAGNVLALPIAQRDWSGEYDYWSGGSETKLTAATQITAVLDDLPEHIDLSNIPLSAEEESRVAWTGVIMQELDEELARVYQVSELSNNGYTGGIVSFIYPDSPAEQAGIQNGDILLRIHVDRLPRPLDIMAEGDFGMDFPWHQLDEVPEEYFEMIPRPWPNVDNAFNRALTGLGFGTECRIELFRDGELVYAPITVVESPTHHDAATQFETEDMGITVRPMTYEVRRYFQKSADDPGVIVSRVEPGSKASVGGIKPYEIVLEINDKPIANTEDFENAITGQDSLRLTIERMRRSRVVKLMFDTPIGGEDAPEGKGDDVDEVGEALQEASNIDE